MIIREVLDSVDGLRLIARTVFEDDFGEEEYEAWIRKYYAILYKLKRSKVKRSDMMFYLHTFPHNDYYYGEVMGYYYHDIKDRKIEAYSIEDLNYKEYASLYVPFVILNKFGYEVVAAEALREYGWNRYDKNIQCPDEILDKVKQLVGTMDHGLSIVDSKYRKICREEFRRSYEGR